MEKPLIWIGAVLTVVGAGAIALFVVPYLGGDVTGGVPVAQRVTPLVAVLIGGLGLAAGCALIGVGVGRWHRPRHSETLPLGQTHHSSEV